MRSTNMINLLIENTEKGQTYSVPVLFDTQKITSVIIIYAYNM